ncbi:trap-type mannitol/chloroaromatic compound transport system, large permease component [Alcanivorax sp. 521-1]|uniref:TRAP transporter large permease protein n=1 Tax=Alloalcanivorax profundimaris TaxID=2735259 RepID=A0ABS0AT61_9GAMM|nr:TRAP transporter large permease subunit [Alloalcanivorax profundimaris]MAO57679.1 TRAP transporter permease DctM/Q [Alcanivorax sp.]MBM1145380.1 TRAP transporter large permease subunit [Alcanivorax sp. ZXX171]MCQ6262793.1 TRAP transporter large permease subunit [Alcanivorax sp. MM125-6]MBF5057314.1 trap-type mannitol/chloroaromatic compound transport system, large permease component [Alloalcanivorax profundimaris]HCE38419.1 TRAP transporter permease DctM/Q [Alcanivorax sp.]|tara:strand:+ start:52564 stop:53874 length:1311 start_codon:yes stop_codon:yes gene_type:complete
MSIEMITLLFFGSLLFFLVLGLPLTFVLGGVSVIFLYFTWGPDAFYMVASQIWSTMGNFTLVAIPLFVFMAMLLERTGVAKDLYRMMYLWWGGLRGGLAIGTLAICAIFAAMCGISGAAVVAMGTIALPSMLERGYDKRMVLGCINTGGGWGILIPPSILMILYSLITGVSVGQMFAAGVLPGILLMVLTCAYIIIRCYFQPELAPALPKEERASWGEKMAALRAVILPILIVVMVLGSIIRGVTTPTEAAAMGVLGALISALVYRRMSWELLRDAAVRTFKLTGMIMWILFAAHAFSAAYQSMGAQEMIQGLITGIPGGPWAIIITMMLIVFLLAMVLDPVGIMLITLPVFLPIVKALGFDPVWFGILFVINMEIGYMTPPFGFNLFYLKGVVPPSITMKDIYVSVIPFVLVEVVGIVLIMMFPEIATYLPDLFF